MTDLSCAAKLHAKIPEPGVVEIKCSSRWCGAGRGIVILHRWDLATGKLIETISYRDPQLNSPTQSNNRRSS